MHGESNMVDIKEKESNVSICPCAMLTPDLDL